MALKVTVSKVNTHAKYKYRVGVPNAGKKDYTYYKTKKAAYAFAKKESKDLEKLGTEHGIFTNEERQAVIYFRESIGKLPESAQANTLRDAVEHYISTLESKHKSMSCSEVSERLIGKLKSEGKSKRYLDSTEQELKRFNSTYGDWLACDVSTDVIDDFIQNLQTVPRRTLEEGEKFTPSALTNSSKLHYRRTLNLFFNHAITLKASTSNPVAKSIKPKAAPPETEVFSPAGVKSILRHAPSNVLPAIALSFFAGIRRAEIVRLDWNDIKLEESSIVIKAGKAKTSQRRVIPITPNLDAILRTCAKSEGPLVQSETVLRSGIKKALKEAKIPNWPRNAGRHSFASYHLAAFNDPGSLSVALGHPNPQLLHKHYKALVSTVDAKKYWTIGLPSTAKKKKEGEAGTQKKAQRTRQHP